MDTASPPHAFPPEWRRGLYQAILKRRDMRHFLPDPVPDDALARVLSAAHHAGSVGFMQPWNFLLVRDRATREKVHAHVTEERLRAAEKFEPARRGKYLSFKLEGILEAPLNLCVTCDPARFGPAVIGRNTIRETDLFSTCCAVQNLWLAARAEGLGCGWVSILKPESLRRLLGIPEPVYPLAYLCLGFVESFPEKPTFETEGWLPRLGLKDLVYDGAWGRAPEPAFTDLLKDVQLI